MNPYSSVLAQLQLEQLRADAARSRLARPRPTRFDRGVSARLRRFAAGMLAAADDQASVLPRLTDYPYRG